MSLVSPASCDRGLLAREPFDRLTALSNVEGRVLVLAGALLAGRQYPACADVVGGEGSLLGRYRL